MATQIQLQNNDNIDFSIRKSSIGLMSTHTSIQPVLNSEISNLFNIKKTQLKMLRTRGYDISKEAHILSWNLSDFSKIYIDFAKSQNITLRSSLTQIYFELPKSNLPKCCVYYADPSEKSTFGKNELRKFIEFLDKYELLNGILITSNPLSSDAKKNKKKLSAYSIQVFQDCEINIDPTEHRLVPCHTVLTEEEVKELVNNNVFNLSNCLIIQPTDPIVKYLGVKKGQVLKIDRFNILGTMVHKYTAYRLVQGVDTNQIEASTLEEVENEGDLDIISTF